MSAGAHSLSEASGDTSHKNSLSYCLDIKATTVPIGTPLCFSFKFLMCRTAPDLELFLKVTDQ